MSGGVGPCCDIQLPNEEVVTATLATGTSKSTVPKGGDKATSRRRRIFTFRQLNALAVMVVLSTSGMVSVQDFAFVVFAFVYMYFISKVVFPQVTPPQVDPVFDETNRTLGLYVFVGAVVGLFLPIAYIFEGIFEGDKEGINAASPHVFLLASQVFMEGVAFMDRFSMPVRVFVAVSFNSRRIFAIFEWLSSEIYKVDEEHNNNNVSGRRLYVGRVLAVANMVFWSFNLFCFLVPVYIPKAFKIYYSNQNQKHNKD